MSNHDGNARCDLPADEKKIAKNYLRVFQIAQLLSRLSGNQVGLFMIQDACCQRFLDHSRRRQNHRGWRR